MARPDVAHVTHVRATVRATRADVHDIGWLPAEGWFCITCGTARCRQIRLVRELVQADPEETT
jgi:hypothetical protein